MISYIYKCFAIVLLSFVVLNDNGSSFAVQASKESIRDTIKQMFLGDLGLSNDTSTTTASSNTGCSRICANIARSLNSLHGATFPDLVEAFGEAGCPYTFIEGSCPYKNNTARIGNKATLSICSYHNSESTTGFNKRATKHNLSFSSCNYADSNTNGTCIINQQNAGKKIELTKVNDNPFKTLPTSEHQKCIAKASTFNPILTDPPTSSYEKTDAPTKFQLEDASFKIQGTSMVTLMAISAFTAFVAMIF